MLLPKPRESSSAQHGSAVASGGSATPSPPSHGVARSPLSVNRVWPPPRTPPPAPLAGLAPLMGASATLPGEAPP
eukprot:9471811-Pyramimonas_sp.AAC.1